MKKSKVKKMITRLTIALISLFLIFSTFVFVSGYSRYIRVSKTTPIKEVVASIQDSPTYYSIDYVSEYFLTPLLAIEDPEFYEHSGFRITNILEALFENVKASGLVEGGSTITQQLSKNLFLDQKKEFDRKVAELFFSLDLERDYDKNEILELYINTSYFGDGYYGIQQASLGYFNVGPSELTLAQGSILAGLLQAPSMYQLSSGFDLAKQRQRIVLDEMMEQNLISEDDATSIYSEDLFERK